MSILEGILLLLLLICAVSVCAAWDLQTAVLIRTAASFVMAAIWIILLFPDLAMAEAAIGTGVTGLLFHAALRRIRQTGPAKETLRPGSSANTHGTGRVDEPLRTAGMSGMSNTPGAGNMEMANGTFLHEEQNGEKPAQLLWRRIRPFAALLTAELVILILLLAVSFLPPFGQAGNPAHNEVSERYISHSRGDTGSLEITNGVFYGYRGFDAMTASCVVFIAAGTVSFLFRRQGKDEENKEADPAQPVPGGNPGLLPEKKTRILILAVFLYGIFLILTGHILPGGGLTGGAVLGAALLLYRHASGPDGRGRWLTRRVRSRILAAAMILYVLAAGCSVLAGNVFPDTGVFPWPGSAPFGLILMFLQNMALGILLGMALII